MKQMIDTTKFSDEHGAAARKAAKAEHPEAAKIVAVTGGYMAFDTLDDYEAWKSQK